MRVLSALRQEIVSGLYEPGQRLPTRAQLQKRFDVSIETVQRALEHLTSDGFVTPRGREGTFVHDAPPHRCRYGLVMAYPSNEARYLRSRYFQALEDAAAQLELGQSRKIIMFHWAHGNTATSDYQLLHREVTNWRLAGLVLCFNFGHSSSPVVAQKGIPRVSLFSGQDETTPRVGIDMDAFFARALDYLRSRGRRRVAVLYSPVNDDHTETLQTTTAWLRKAGLETNPLWLFPCSSGMPVSAAAAVHLMANLSGDRRPDSLIIADDHLVARAGEGMLRAGLRPGEDWDVVAHWNWPLTAAVPQGVRLLGFDAREVLLECVRCLDLQRQGCQVQTVSLVPPQWAGEVSDVRRAGNLLPAPPTER